MALRSSADQAERAADGFSSFRAPLPEHATEITGLISDFYAISSSLSSLDDLSKDPRYRRSWALVHPDVELLRSSLKYTIEDILDFFNRLDGGHASSDTYQRTWLSIERFFWNEAQYSLGTRLAKYKSFLRELVDAVRDPRHESPLLAVSRSNTKVLLVEQEKRLAPRLARLSLGRKPPSTGSTSTDQPSPRKERRPPLRQRSYERSRPPHVSPQSPTSPSSASFSDFPPSVPEVPSSPLGSASATGTSQSTHSDVIEYHWVKEVFSTYDTETPIPPGRERAGCFGDAHAGIKPWLREQGFDLLLELAFNDDSNMTVFFYLRERDHRVRIVCKVPHRSRPSDYYCLPLNLLEVIREGSCLQLCRRRHGGSELVLWASIQFTTMESMVAFYVAFLALRSQDAGHPVEDIRDYELEGERQIYGGQIIDDDYAHALRVYRDKTTKSVRLQASVHKGDMDHTPVWTAFITSHLSRRSWLRVVDHRTVIIRNLKPIVLIPADDYTPPLNDRNEYELTFATTEDADSFLDQMEALAAKY
ncbi:uncharacterized protein N7496_001639 [Penicillium cataractarum]|uniref:Uncharacterized protein n=1 Tax=Penicillium cataractarum TaxID=2100454 RepID=A0A9W9VWC2_9EURO|nr:uncharacterized protein N7496_001639 [Penicillium cataractarum]KAJ5390571.1 hypothetical protein N7496_001639 [Penicillium cataractarum]